MKKRIQVNISRDLHSKAVRAAHLRGQSIRYFTEDAIRQFLPDVIETRKNSPEKIKRSTKTETFNYWYVEYAEDKDGKAPLTNQPFDKLETLRRKVNEIVEYLEANEPSSPKMIQEMEQIADEINN